MLSIYPTIRTPVIAATKTNLSRLVLDVAKAGIGTRPFSLTRNPHHLEPRAIEPGTRRPSYAEQTWRLHPLWCHFAPRASFFDDLFALSPFRVVAPQRHPAFHGWDGRFRFRRWSPGYEIHESDTEYQIRMDIPQGMTASDIQVELEQNDTVLHVAGERPLEEERDNRLGRTRFDHHFSVRGSNMDLVQLTAQLSSDGVLVVKAPKRPQLKRRIGIITEQGPAVELTSEEVAQTNFSDSFDESDWAETGKEGTK